MIYLVNSDAVFIFGYVDVNEIQFCPFLEGIVKDSIKLFYRYFKANHILCCHEDIICFNCRRRFICFVNPLEYRVLRLTSDNIDCYEDIF